MPSQVRIIARTRPTDAETTGFQIASETAVRITRPGPQATPSMFSAKSRQSGSGSGGAGGGSGGAASGDESVLFSVNAVLHNASQEAVYNVAVSDLTEAALLGVNCTLLCYGQSGAGKTYTLFGGDSYPTRGCIPRALQELFDAMHNSTERDFKVSVSFVEVYGEQVYDLLGKGPSASECIAATNPASPTTTTAAAAGGGGGAQLSATAPSGGGGGAAHSVGRAAVVIDGHGAVLLRGVEERRCATEAEALAAVFEGQQRRFTGTSALNPCRSRSHAVLTVYIVSKSLLDSDALTHHSRLNFVDLAGSERLHDDAASHEAQTINRSLTMLEQVILALAGSRQRHVPYRQSKLTMLLKNAIGGTSKTTLVANVWPEARHTEATLATLNFAKRMMRVESVPSVQASMDLNAQVKLLQKEVISLKSELRMQDQLAGREAVSGAPLDSDEIASARERVVAFVEGTMPQVRVSGVRDMHACFMVFKGLVAERDSRLVVAEQKLLAPPSSRPGTASNANASKSGSGGGAAGRRTPSINALSSAPDAKPAAGRQVATVPDASSGVGVGRTDQPSAALKDMFQQQQRRGSSRPMSGPPAGGAPGSDGLQAQAQAQALAQAQAQAQAQALGIGSPGPLRPSSATAGCERSPGPLPLAAAPPPRPPVPATGTLSALAVVPTPPQPMRDKRAAFDLYKRTVAGAGQLAAIAEAQRLVVAKGAAAAQLQRRVEELRALISNTETGTGSRMAETVGSGSVNNNTHSMMSNGSDGVAEDAGALSTAERLALLRHTHSAATRAETEHAILTKQLNRKREAFMSSFDMWFRLRCQQQQQQQMARLPSVGATAKAARELPQPAARVAFLPAEADTRFMDGAERFEASEMRRRLQEDPEGATYYAAQRLVRRGLFSRGSGA